MAKTRTFGVWIDDTNLTKDDWEHVDKELRRQAELRGCDPNSMSDLHTYKDHLSHRTTVSAQFTEKEHE